MIFKTARLVATDRNMLTCKSWALWLYQALLICLNLAQFIKVSQSALDLNKRLGNELWPRGIHSCPWYPSFHLCSCQMWVTAWLFDAFMLMRSLDLLIVQISFVIDMLNPFWLDLAVLLLKVDYVVGFDYDDSVSVVWVAESVIDIGTNLCVCAVESRNVEDLTLSGEPLLLESFDHEL